MYICGWETLALKGGRIAKRGQPVPEAEEWPYHIQQANLRLGTILKEVGPGTDLKAPARSETAVQVSTTTEPAKDAEKRFQPRRGRR